MRTPLLLGGLALTLSACGQTVASSEGGELADTEVVAAGMVIQTTDDAEPEFCVGGVAASLPPQCGGPALAGEFSWDDVNGEQASGVRWTEEWYYGVGFLDRTADTFTLTRPLSSAPPEGWALPEEEPEEFPQLCDDPFRGGDEDYDDPNYDIQNAFQERLETLPGYSMSWVSDGERMFNVIVSGDAEEAHAELRTIWPGGLCVEQRDMPTAQDTESATQALSKHADELGLLQWGGQGEMSIHVALADAATVARIHEIVSPWLTPDDVRITSAFTPLSASS